MATQGLYLFPAGINEIDKGLLTYRVDMGKKVRVPIMMALVKTDDGNILFDTGLNPDGLRDPIKIWGERAANMIKKFGPEDDVRSRLRELNLGVDDIRYVVNSHFHWDHTGGNQFFTKSKFIVQKAEYRYAFYPDSFTAGSFVKHHFDHPLDYELIEGDMELVPGVSLVLTPGHSPGHQSMIVDLPESGTIVLTGDSIYTKENIEKNIPIGVVWDPGQAMISMRRLIHIAKREKGKIFICHDPETWNDLKPSPYCYR
jgi:N-acyl homoserine lactone hydrolase